MSAYYTVQRVAGGPRKFSEFVDKHGVGLVVKERPRGTMADEDCRYHADFLELVEIKEGGMLKGCFGNGRTPEKAIEELKRNVAGRLLVKNANSAGRIEFRAPNDWLSE